MVAACAALQVSASRDAGLHPNMPLPTTPGQRREMRVTAELYIRTAQRRMQGFEEQAQMLEALLACMGSAGAGESAGDRTADRQRTGAAANASSAGSGVLRGEGVVEMLRYRAMRRARHLLRQAAAHAPDSSSGSETSASTSTSPAPHAAGAGGHTDGSLTVSAPRATAAAHVPRNFLCPITHGLMRDPVVVSSGHTFERSAITRWLEMGQRTNPVTSECSGGLAIKGPSSVLGDCVWLCMPC